MILISIDGFRADYLDRGATPTLSRLAREGARGSMRPGFPSVTFPNHYALITGKSPDHNGIVYNKMEDAGLPGKTFSMSPSVASDVRWWAQATPLWVTAERQGVKTATMFWPGSTIRSKACGRRNGGCSTRTLPPSRAWTSCSAGSMRLLREAAPADALFRHRRHRRPPLWARCAGDGLDNLEVDAAIARLKLTAWKSRGLAANLVIVADHGDGRTSRQTRVMDMAKLAPPDIARVLWDGTTAGVYPVAGREADAERALLGRKEHGECWRKGEMPALRLWNQSARASDRVPRRHGLELSHRAAEG